MKIVVVGCGRVGAELAHRFVGKGHDVTVVDHQHQALDALSPDFRGRIVEGEPLAQDTLHRAGVAEADGVAVVTDNDTVNAVVAHVCNTVYHVPRVVVRNYDPRRLPLLEAFNLQAIGSIMWGAHRLEEMLYNTDTETVFSAGNGEVEIIEMVIPPAWQQRTLAELITGVECVPAAITRNGRAALPAVGGLLEANDLLHVSATPDAARILRARLGQEA
ncbi:MAG: TrkA family potassium uptake protein [Armatimonadetes bacterium]|nr:TrkA family potassium uptake protein [Armatimonadota bacterium]